MSTAQLNRQNDRPAQEAGEEIALEHLTKNPDSEFRRSIPGITERMLIRHLQELESDGILVRQQENRVPPVGAVFHLQLWNDAFAGARSDLRMGKKASEVDS